jgi:hypothetical protein
MTPQDFKHWFAKHGAMPVGARPEDYHLAEQIAWKAYLRGKKDQTRKDRT